jgi:hypothetical protein
VRPAGADSDGIHRNTTPIRMHICAWPIRALASIHATVTQSKANGGASTISS